jgi:hypothetical protein
VVECENQTLGEAIDLVGTGLSLTYRSDRVPGRASAFRLRIPLTGSAIAFELRALWWSAKIAGRTFLDSALAATNLDTTFAAAPRVQPS